MCQCFHYPHHRTPARTCRKACPKYPAVYLFTKEPLLLLLIIISLSFFPLPSLLTHSWLHHHLAKRDELVPFITKNWKKGVEIQSFLGGRNMKKRLTFNINVIDSACGSWYSAEPTSELARESVKPKTNSLMSSDSWDIKGEQQDGKNILTHSIVCFCWAGVLGKPRGRVGAVALFVDNGRKRLKR